jgi:hypothetical protein
MKWDRARHARVAADCTRGEARVPGGRQGETGGLQGLRPPRIFGEETRVRGYLRGWDLLLLVLRRSIVVPLVLLGIGSACEAISGLDGLSEYTSCGGGCVGGVEDSGKDATTSSLDGAVSASHGTVQDARDGGAASTSDGTVEDGSDGGGRDSAASTSDGAAPDAGGPFTLVQGVGLPQALVVDDTSLYFINAQGGATASVQSILKSGAGPVTTLASNQPSPLDIAVDDTNVYWSVNRGAPPDSSTQCLAMFASKDGGAPAMRDEWWVRIGSDDGQ